MSPETLEMPANETLEQKRDQLISEYEDLALQVEKEKERIEFEDSGKIPLENYPSFVNLQDQLKQKEEEIAAANQGMESVETTETPEIATAGKIVEAKFNDLEKGISTQNEIAEKELGRLEAAMIKTEADIKAAQSEDEKLGLNFILLGLKKKSDNIKEGLRLEAERKLQKAA